MVSSISEQRERCLSLMHRYAASLDRRDWAQWLDLFTEETSYKVITSENFAKSSLLYLIDEDRGRLKSRCYTYEASPLSKSLHVISNVEPGRNGASDSVPLAANFLVFRNGQQMFVGEYRMDLAPQGDEMRIRNCLVLLDGLSVLQEIPVPI